MAEGYLVLARKYRPRTFDDLVGQEALVRTLTNAIEAQRIHHAYVLTGIRGVGKTTTARIIAKALNCENGPSVTWAEDDGQATSIEQGRHVDVLEFDAASHTGIDDIKDLFEGVAYAPVMGRFKVYIIDEVHMLSNKAFNALLKTLEEPPPQVKFLFATTEVHKIPVTVLSRCQRFDLRRISTEKLVTLYTDILGKEGIAADEAAIRMVARAADGSARDGLSLLDQAIALSAGKEIKEALVAEMLGLGDRSRVFDLFEALMTGGAEAALKVFDDMYALGQDPLLVMRELLELAHLCTRIKLVSGLKDGGELSEFEKTRAVPLAEKLPMENLSRAYQMLLHALQEAKVADRPHEAVQMAIVRLTHLAPLPPLEKLIGQVAEGTEVAPVKKPVEASAPQEREEVKLVSQPVSAVEDSAGLTAWAEAAVGDVPAAAEGEAGFTSWNEAVAAIKQKEGGFGAMLEHQVLCHDFADGKMRLSVKAGTLSENEIVNGLRRQLKGLTHKPWDVVVTAADENSGGETVAAQKVRAREEDIENVKTHADVQKILSAFPDAEITEVN
jgi:DNA polymerase-3 subunit gamma/tau